LLSSTSLHADPAAAKPREFASLFDGRTLDGWEGDRNLWRVERGAIVGEITGSLDHNEFLIHRLPVRDFRFFVEVFLETADNNSGIQFRSRRIEDGDHTSVAGYQADIGGPGGMYWGRLYHEHGRGWLSEKSAANRVARGVWNSYEILAVGSRLRTAVNGQVCVDMDDPAGEREGVFALQLHAGGPMRARFRNLRLELDPKFELRSIPRREWDNPYNPKPRATMTPQQSLESMSVPDGFRVDLIAAEPDVRQPIAMTFDDRGRLWVVEGHSYPQKRPEGKGVDNILIFADTDGDGTYDSRKVFARGLNFVTGMEVGFGGVWLGAAPELLFIPDRDGDDRPDGPPQVLLDGWGLQDTHEMLNSFNWGPDGWLYGCHGVFVESAVGKPGTPANERTRITACIWRYHPLRHEFEVFAHGGSNQWGVDFDDRGQAFMTTCRSRNGGGPVTHVVHGGYYWRQGGTHYYPYVYSPMLAATDHGHGLGGAGGNRHVFGGHTHCSAAVYLGDDWPDEYRGRLYTHNVLGKVLNQELLQRHGSGYLVRHANEDVLEVGDLLFLGTTLRYGPDGAMVFADWYDVRSCHYREIEAWDRTNGRLYRMSWGAPNTVDPAAIDLPKRSDLELARLQTHRNDWYVRAARRVLQYRAAQGAIDSAARSELRMQLNHADQPRRVRLRALWALHAIGELDVRLALSLLRSSEEDLRAWTIQLVCERVGGASELLEQFAVLAASDPSPVVRLYLASALQRLTLEERWPLVERLTAHAEDAGDQNLPQMLWFGMEPLVMTDLRRALKLAVESRRPALARWIYRRAASEPRGLDAIVTLLVHTTNAELKSMLVEAMSLALRGRRTVPRPTGWQRIAAELLASSDVVLRHRAETLATQFGERALLSSKRTTLADRAATIGERRHAFDLIELARDTGAITVVQGLLDDAAFRARAIRALAAFDDRSTPELLIAGYSSFNVDEKKNAVATLVSRPASALAFLDAIAAERIPRDALTPFWARQIARYKEPQIAAKLATIWGRHRGANAEKKALIAKYRKIYQRSAEWMFSGVKGREAYRKICSPCHTLHGEGVEIGPDLTGSNRRDLDYLLENVIDPSSMIGKDFQLWNLVAADGRVVSGLLETSTDKTVTIRTQEASVTVPREEILDLSKSADSMMPEGLLDELDDQQFQNLIKYLRSS